MKQVVLIAAGGTGGHIYPALAIAEALQSRHANVQIEFVGTTDGIENEIIPQHGYTLHQLSIGRLHKSVGWRERVTTVLRLPLAMAKAVSLCLHRKPRFLLGVGGHASGPMILAGALLRYPTFIWEPNAMPGLANRILSRFVDEAIVVFTQARKHLQTESVTLLGFPVRKSIETAGELGQEPRTHEKLKILVSMGSQGAQSMNHLIPEMLSAFPEMQQQFEFVHATGKKNYDQTLAIYEKNQVVSSVKLLPYIEDMQNKYVWSDVVISRSGTGTLSEIAATGKPAVLVPLPHAADDHQRRNAEAFVEKKAALMIDQRDLSKETLRDTLVSLRQSPDLRKQLGERAFSLHVSNSADKIADHLWKGSEVEHEEP